MLLFCTCQGERRLSHSDRDLLATNGNDAWNLGKVIYDQNGYVVCYSGYFVQATSDAAVSINLMTVESGQGWTNSRMVKMAFGQVLLTSFHPQMS
jgi:hypothetical protein